MFYILNISNNIKKGGVILQKFKNIFLYCFLFIICFFTIRFVYMNILYHHTMIIFDFIYYRMHPNDDFYFVLFMILFLTFIGTTFIYQIIKGGLNKRFIKILYIFYFLFLIYFLFFKTIGISGVNFNILDTINSILYGGAIIVFMNIVFFIPLGCLFKLTKKSSIIFLISILFVELSQNIFYLGIFDINDIILNYMGFVIGNTFIENNKVKNILFNNSNKDI